METNEQFIARLYPSARKIAEETGLSWELMLAQAVHETGWGRRVLPGTNNMFNVKAFGGWTGESKTFRVHETYGNNGEKTWEDHPFRVYKTVEDSFRDRANFLRENPRYAKAGLFDEGTLGNLEGEARALQRAGFATDKSYAKYLADVFNGRTMRRGIALATGQEISQGAVTAGERSDVLREGHRSAAVGELQSRL